MSVVCFVLIICLLHGMFQLCSVFICDVIVCMIYRSHLNNLAALGPGWRQIMEFSKPWVVSILWYQTALHKTLSNKFSVLYSVLMHRHIFWVNTRTSLF